MIPIFITGIGTNIGKTVISVIIANAIGADYWKPIQSGLEEETDSQIVKRLLSNVDNQAHPEIYRLRLPASPHIAAENEGIRIDIETIVRQTPKVNGYLVIEGAGGLMVPLNKQDLMSDLIFELHAKVILVSRHYLGSINHSLLTAEVCKHKRLDVMGWIFNDEFMHYGDDIVRRSGYPLIGAIPKLKDLTAETLHLQSLSLKDNLLKMLEKG